MSHRKPSVRFSPTKTLVFMFVPCVVLIASLEFVLWLAGVEPLSRRGDPSSGFSGLVSVFERDGAHYRTRQFKGPSPFNDQSFLVDKPDGGLRIMTLGGSSAYGHPWGGHVAFTALLGEFLRVAYPNRRIEAVNVAGVSYAMHRLEIVARELLAYEPDVVIVYSGHNEFVEPSFALGKAQQSQLRNRAELIAAHSRLYSGLHALYAQLETAPVSVDEHFDLVVERNESHAYTTADKGAFVERFRGGLENILRAASQHKRNRVTGLPGRQNKITALSCYPIALCNTVRPEQNHHQ